MSWLFSQALVEEYSEGTSLAGEPFAQLNAMPTPHKFWRNDKTMEACDLSRFGLTLRLLTDDLGADLLTSFLEASRVRTLVRPAPALGLKEAGPAFGSRWPELSAKYDLSGSTWRTHLCLWDEVLPWSSVILPKWGSMSGGVVYQQPTSVHPMIGIAPGWSGETLPTPSVAMSKGSSEGALTRVDGRSRLRNRLDYWVERDGKNGRLNPLFVEWVMGWPAGWTALEPLETAKFHEWQQQHSICFADDGSISTPQ